MIFNDKMAINVKCGDYISIPSDGTGLGVALLVHGIDDGFGFRRFWGKDDAWVIEARNDAPIMVADLAGFIPKSKDEKEI